MSWWQNSIIFFKNKFSSIESNSMGVEKICTKKHTQCTRGLVVDNCWHQYPQSPYSTLCFTYHVLLLTSLLLVATTLAFLPQKLSLFHKFAWVFTRWPASLTFPYSESKDWQGENSGILLFRFVNFHLWPKKSELILCKTCWVLQELDGNLVINDSEACNDGVSINMIPHFISFYFLYLFKY